MEIEDEEDAGYRESADEIVRCYTYTIYSTYIGYRIR